MEEVAELGSTSPGLARAPGETEYVEPDLAMASSPFLDGAPVDPGKKIELREVDNTEPEYAAPLGSNGEIWRIGLGLLIWLESVEF